MTCPMSPRFFFNMIGFDYLLAWKRRQYRLLKIWLNGEGTLTLRAVIPSLSAKRGLHNMSIRHMQNDLNFCCYGELFVAKRTFLLKRMIHILSPVSVAGISSLKKLPVKRSSPADVLFTETFLATKASPAATVLLSSEKVILHMLHSVSPALKNVD